MFCIISPSSCLIMENCSFLFDSGGFDVRLILLTGDCLISSPECLLFINTTTRLFISWPTVLSLEYHGALHLMVRGTSAKKHLSTATCISLTTESM